ncbi:MAG TPA: 2-oxoglutarate dehydrogenase complex dihydrolipoyllysine-residue succinyltransferase, partial [Gemmatimonadaceae bacterium]|nr:2-oxoglutarate dehydrogenase complex dihydrolipoyllysine-residue succinyltransferase [Gemmatimonadaceae bacterium]
IARWLKKDGDAVGAGETLVELETDKITVEVPAPKAGRLTRRAAKEGDVVKVDQLLGEIDETAAGAAAQPQAAAPAPAPAAAPAPQQAAPASQPQRDGGAVKASPAAQRVAAEQNIDLAAVSGTGRGGVVSKPDVVEFAARVGSAPSAESRASSAAPAPSAERPSAASIAAMAPRPADGARETREKMTTRRKRIAENLLHAKQATAMLTTFNEIDMTNVNALRERFREKTEKQHGVKLTFMPFFVKACTLALREIPVLNAQIDGDSIVYKHYVNMGIAVASDAGLVVPNIRDAHAKGILDISRDIAAVAKKARDGKLTMEDLTGGTFTITNGGVFGSLMSTPILNHPQVGILGLHKTQDRPVAVNGKIEIRPMMYVALSYDHRIVDGQHSVLFLVRVKELMEDPAAMLIE